MEATEALKLFFNLALVETSKVDADRSEEDLQKSFATKFEACISSILNLIKGISLSATNPLSSPLLNAVHALLHVPYSSSWDRDVVTKLTEALILAVPDLVGDEEEENFDRLREEQVDDTIAPVLLVLRKAAANDKVSREYLSQTLLPSERYVVTAATVRASNMASIDNSTLTTIYLPLATGLSQSIREAIFQLA